MIIGNTFDAIAKDLSSRKTEKSKQVLIVFCDDVALKYYKRYLSSNKQFILTSFDEINRRGLVGLHYKEFFVLNFITDIESIKDEIETFISYFIERKGEKNATI